MNVTLRRLPAFAGVYRTRSITRAARERHHAIGGKPADPAARNPVRRQIVRPTRSVQPTPAADEAFTPPNAC
jgi:hypothetical protein